MAFRFMPGTAARNSKGEDLSLKIVNCYLTVRSRPLLRGDLDDNGAIQIPDAVRSLRLAAGLESAPPPPYSGVDLPAVAYARAAGDADWDGQLTVMDSVQILRWIVGLP